MCSMSNGLVKGSSLHDYVCRNSAFSGLRVTKVSTIQWNLMYTNIGKLICYTRRLSTIQGACLEGFHCNIATYPVIILNIIELLNYII